MTVKKFPTPKPPPPARPPGLPAPFSMAELAPLVPLAKAILGDVLRQSNRVTTLNAGGMIGTMKVTAGEVPGCIIAFRSGGEEVLFAGRDRRALTWIPTKDFSIEPALIATVEDLRKASGS